MRRLVDWLMRFEMKLLFVVVPPSLVAAVDLGIVSFCIPLSSLLEFKKT
jgi:hypothetical protein